MQYETGLSDDHARWLEGRQVSIEAAAEIGMFSKGCELAFPYHQPDGTPAFTKWRGPEKKFRIEPNGQKLALWLLDRWHDVSSDTLVITEGEIDALSFLTAGASCVVSVPNGAWGRPGEGDIVPASDTGFSFLWRGDALHPELARFKRFILATDADAPGQVLRDELAIRLGRDRCLFVAYPDGCKDTNDVLVKHGRKAVLALIETARPIVPDQLVPFSAIPRASGTSFSSGWGDLDAHLLIALPEVMVISGPPNHGKSQLALALVANLARVHRLRGAILQFEDDVDRHRDDLMRYARAWQNGNGARTIKIAPEAWIDAHFLTVPPPETIDDAADKTLAWLFERIEEAATRHGCKLVLLDPWNEVEHAWGVNETETGYTGKALRQLRALARKYQLLIIIVCHPSKAGGMKQPDEMTPYDIAGSAHFANKPDHVLLIHRDKGSDETVVNIAKCRDYRRRGLPGTVRMKFDPRSATFTYIGKA
jgi:twinkle protein